MTYINKQIGKKNRNINFNNLIYLKNQIKTKKKQKNINLKKILIKIYLKNNN